MLKCQVIELKIMNFTKVNFTFYVCFVFGIKEKENTFEVFFKTNLDNLRVNNGSLFGNKS